MGGYIDMHCHILPEVDDGAKSIEEMEKMLKIAYDEGIRCMIATPHYHPRRGREHPEILFERLKTVRRAAHRIDARFRVYLGTEIYFGQDIPEKLKKGRVLSMNKRDIVLVEFSPSDTYTYIQQGIQQLQMNGYEVILAHVERYRCLVENVVYAEHLWEMGTLIQINAGSITGDSGRKIRKYVKELMDRNLVFCVGTDAHGAMHRVPRMKKAADYVGKRYGEDYMRRIFFGNAKGMLKRRVENEI